MADDKDGRENQAANAERRQREREIEEAVERADEPEPPIEERDEALGELDHELETHDYPVKGRDLIEAHGDSEVESEGERTTVAETLANVEDETIETAAEAKTRIVRPTVAHALDRIEAASRAMRDGQSLGDRRTAYAKTLHALKSIDADDEDEGIEVVTDWIVDQIEEEGERPKSKVVRKRAAEFARENGYEIRNDEWLGR